MFTPVGRGILIASLGMFSIGLSVAGSIRGDDALKQRATWAPPLPEAVKVELEGWLGGRITDDATRQPIDALWPTDGSVGAGPDTLDRLVSTLALVDSGSREIFEFCRGAAVVSEPPKFALLNDQGFPPMVRNNRLTCQRSNFHFERFAT